jgi:hypothetical protein
LNALRRLTHLAARICGPSYQHQVYSYCFYSRGIYCHSLSGADDDGSGSVTILEAYRALITSDFRPERTVEFHWYSAEVMGIALLRHIDSVLILKFRKADFLGHKLLPRIMNLVQ